MKDIIFGFDVRIVLLIALVLQTYISVYVGTLSYRLSKEHVLKSMQRRLKVNSRGMIDSMLINSKNEKNNFDAIESKLVSKGYKFYFNNIEPYKYIEVKAYCCIIGMLIGVVTLKFVGVALGALIGFYAIDIYATYLNNKDKEQIQDDIRIMMAALRVQSATNVYITDTITECYYEVSNPRLKKALLEFTGDLRAHVDINEAADALASKFNDKYIDNLVVVIKQLFKSGKSANMLGHINKQMIALQREMIVADKRKTETDQIVSMFFLLVVIFMYIMTNLTSIMGTDLF